MYVYYISDSLIKIKHCRLNGPIPSTLVVHFTSLHHKSKAYDT